jgi:hypothetical protein
MFGPLCQRGGKGQRRSGQSEETRDDAEQPAPHDRRRGFNPIRDNQGNRSQKRHQQEGDLVIQRRNYRQTAKNAGPQIGQRKGWPRLGAKRPRQPN